MSLAKPETSISNSGSDSLLRVSHPLGPSPLAASPLSSSFVNSSSESIQNPLLSPKMEEDSSEPESWKSFTNFKLGWPRTDPLLLLRENHIFHIQRLILLYPVNRNKSNYYYYYYYKKAFCYYVCVLYMCVIEINQIIIITSSLLLCVYMCAYVW